MKAKNLLFSVVMLMYGALITACGNGDPDTGLTDDPDDFDDLRSYSSTGTYSSVITQCVKAERASSSCTLETLPFLGQEVENPTINDIMNRLVISHDWMAENFEDILNLLPPEILPLFKGLTAIVIDDDIRPAFYTTSTGAIYLDPAYLWLTVEDKQTINIKDDYRAGFDDELAFQALGFYTNGNQYAFDYGSLTDSNPRSIDDTVYLFARLILHELAHANDFIPADSYDLLTSTMTPSQAASSLTSHRPSNELDTTYPLLSQLNIDFAEIMYFGETATTTQKLVTAEEIGLEFEPDGASDHYAYSNQFEDAAMLFETALMKQFFDFDYDVSFTSMPTDPQSCDDYIVEWGEFNRIGDSNVKARAQYIIGELLPNLDTTLFFQDLAGPSSMTTGISWCDNRDSKPVEGEANSTLRAKPSSSSPEGMPLERLRRPYI